jgi:hypothetical protein
MALRQKIAILLFLIGLFLILGAMGQADFSAIISTEFFARTGIGLALVLISLPVSGELDADE